MRPRLRIRPSPPDVASVPRSTAGTDQPHVAPRTVGAAALRDAAPTSEVAHATLVVDEAAVVAGAGGALFVGALRPVGDHPSAAVSAEKRGGISLRLVAVGVGAVVLVVLLVAGLVYWSRRRRWSTR